MRNCSENSWSSRERAVKAPRVDRVILSGSGDRVVSDRPFPKVSTNQVDTVNGEVEVAGWTTPG